MAKQSRRNEKWHGGIRFGKSFVYFKMYICTYIHFNKLKCFYDFLTSYATFLSSIVVYSPEKCGGIRKGLMPLCHLF